MNFFIIAVVFTLQVISGQFLTEIVAKEAVSAAGNITSEMLKIESGEISSVIENQLKALRSKDISAAYKNFTTKSFQSSTSFEEYRKMVEAKKPLIENKLFRYDSFYIESGVATFAGDLVANDGSFIQAEFDVVKEDNVWKINGMELFQFEQTAFPHY